MKLGPHCFQLVWGKMATAWERTVRVDRIRMEPVSGQKVWDGKFGQINNPKWGAGASGTWGNIQTSVEFEVSGRCGSPEQAYPWLYSIIMWPLPPQELSECKAEESWNSGSSDFSLTLMGNVVLVRHCLHGFADPRSALQPVLPSCPAI